MELARAPLFVFEHPLVTLFLSENESAVLDILHVFQEDHGLCLLVLLLLFFFFLLSYLLCFFIFWLLSGIFLLFLSCSLLVV